MKLKPLYPLSRFPGFVELGSRIEQDFIPHTTPSQRPLFWAKRGETELNRAKLGRDNNRNVKFYCTPEHETFYRKNYTFIP